MGEARGINGQSHVHQMIEKAFEQTTNHFESSIKYLADITFKREMSYIDTSLTNYIADERRQLPGGASEIPCRQGSILTTSNQLKAARALVGLGQIALAERAGLNVNTIRRMEAVGSGPLPGLSSNVQAVQRVLEEAGVEFLGGDQPGVRLHRKHARTV
jgi:hypothetical protein